MRATTSIVFSTMATACGFSVEAPITQPDAATPDVAVDAPFCVPPTRPQLELVQQGDLVINAGDRSVSMPLQPVALDRSVLFVTMREVEASPTHGAVICRLVASPLGVRCQRYTAGTDTAGSSGVVNVHWAVATFSSGVRVQHGDANTGAVNPLRVNLATAVDLNTSFVLLSGGLVGGTGWGNNEFVMARLVDASTLDVRTAAGGTQTWWQVVTMEGTSVQRGTATLGASEITSTTPILEVDAPLVVTSYTVNSTMTPSAAAMMVSASQNGAQLTFERRLAGVQLDLAWEVISVPFFRQTVRTDFGASEVQRMTAIANLPAGTSVAVASAQSVLGPSTGTTAYTGGLQDLIGEAAVSLTPVDGGVLAQRSTGTEAGSITWTVMDLAHSPCDLR